MPPGNDWHASKAFARICIHEHDAGSRIFNQDEQVAYAMGPAVTGEERPWSTIWAAWVSQSGIRIANAASVTPKTAGGNPSSLFPTEKPTELALGFTHIGQIAIAIQKNDESIQIKWFKDDSGTVESIGDVSFLGEHPALFSNGLVVNGDSDDSDLVLYYTKAAEPRRIYARFEREHFTIERLVNANIQAPLDRLMSSEAVGRKQLLYARDEYGRDITFYSPEYSIDIDEDEVTLDLSFTGGSYIDRAINADAGDDIATLSVAFISGSYYDPIEEPPAALSDDKATLSIAFTAGEYS